MQERFGNLTIIVSKKILKKKENLLIILLLSNKHGLASEHTIIDKVSSSPANKWINAVNTGFGTFVVGLNYFLNYLLRAKRIPIRSA